MAIAIQALWQRLAAWPPARRVSERSAKHFPLGYFMIAQRLGAFQPAVLTPILANSERFALSFFAATG